MIAYRPNTEGKITGKLVPAAPADPGGIDPAQLAQYWRKDSAAAAKPMAFRLGIRRIAGKYSWLAVWSAEGLSTPPASSWTALQQNHLITDEVAALLACDARTIRRYDKIRLKVSRPRSLRAASHGCGAPVRFTPTSPDAQSLVFDATTPSRRRALRLGTSPRPPPRRRQARTHSTPFAVNDGQYRDVSDSSNRYRS